MQLQFQTSSSEMIPISDFRYLYDLARCSKCQMFILLRGTNKLYGTNDECTFLHEIDVPYLVNTDLTFRMDCTDKEIVEQYKDFFIPEKFNWVILPDYYWEAYIGGDLVAMFDNATDRYEIYDKNTGLPIHQIHMYKQRVVNDYQSGKFINQLEGFLTRLNTLSIPVMFTNAQDNESIRQAFDSKTAMGRFLCVFSDNLGCKVAFYFYKGMFSLNKGDTADLWVRFDRYNNKLFLATFIPKKKKNPLKHNTYGVPFIEKIHIMYLNIA